MSITDELREWAGGSTISSWTAEHLTAIADRIDVEHEAACAEAYGNGVMSVPIALDESAWVKLPVDADGEVIHVGDELDVGFVARIVITDDEWPSYLYAYKETPHILTQHFCNEVSHYHAPTVEDVLLEACKAYHGLMVEGMSDFAHDMPAPSEIIAEFAAKLRLAKEGE